MTEIVNVMETESPPIAHATLYGEPLIALPEGLYIPPEALRVFLEAFEGPLDLLLYLIRKNNLDILDIPIAMITAQYVEYIGLMQEMQLELAADYLVMAAMLAEIKSRMLLPRPVAEDGSDEGDPRAELVRRLQEYECFRQAAQTLHDLPQKDRDFFVASVTPPPCEAHRPQPVVTLDDLMNAMREVLRRAQLKTSHKIPRENITVHERMTQILDFLKDKSTASFYALCESAPSRIGIVVTFCAVLELLKRSLIALSQSEPLAPIQVRTCV